MGQTLKILSERELQDQPVFSNRFVTEICEKVHIHYRNLRLMMELSDWLRFCEGIKDSLERWNKRGNPEPNPKKHIELCRKQIAAKNISNKILINLNKNLYPQNEGRIFSEGANFTEDEYIHLKIRDIRLELSKNDFKELIYAVKEAEKALESSGSGSLLQKT